jgi:Do/DeqQ family serine protease
MSASVSRLSSRLLLGAALIVTVGSAAVWPTNSQAQLAGIPTRDGMPTLAPLIDKVVPAVVNIAVKSKDDMTNNPLFKDPMFRRFFDIPDRPTPRERRSVGSGIIVDAKKGYILTNHHVVDDASEILVRLKDGRELTAKKLGSDEGTDVALLQVEAKDLTDLPIGDSGKLLVGDFVVAVGNPFGIGQTVTSGIVSALSRAIGIEGYEDFIQTDAAINPGNSGGPLVNLKGEMVGMNTAILGGNGGGNVGIGFAVPTSIVKNVMDQLAEYGEVRRGRIGVQIIDLTPDLAKNLGIDQNEGAVIQRVEKDSPGDKAGLKAGDVAVVLDGKPVKGSSDLRNRVGLAQVGNTVTLTVMRDGRKMDVRVKLEKIPEKQEVAAIEERETLQGASFVNPEGGDNGIVVKEVQRGSPAWQAGLRERDVVAAVNRKAVKSVDEFEKALKDGGRQVALSVKRGNEDLFLIIQ